MPRPRRAAARQHAPAAGAGKSVAAASDAGAALAAHALPACGPSTPSREGVAAAPPPQPAPAHATCAHAALPGRTVRAAPRARPASRPRTRGSTLKLAAAARA
jgi:hypothetical protein